MNSINDSLREALTVLEYLDIFNLSRTDEMNELWNEIVRPKGNQVHPDTKILNVFEIFVRTSNIFSVS